MTRQVNVLEDEILHQNILNHFPSPLITHQGYDRILAPKKIPWPNFQDYEYNNGEGSGTPPQYSCLENPTDGGAWKPAVHRVAEGRTRLSDFTFTFHFHALEKETASHSSVLAWKIPGTEEPGRLPSMGSHRVGHD